MSETTRRFRITGRVQGVNFRHRTRLEAERLGLAGHAWNLPDGSVEVLASGDASAIETLRRWLEHGPRTARVDAVVELPSTPEHAPAARFEVR